MLDKLICTVFSLKRWCVVWFVVVSLQKCFCQFNTEGLEPELWPDLFTQMAYFEVDDGLLLTTENSNASIVRVYTGIS